MKKIITEKPFVKRTQKLNKKDSHKDLGEIKKPSILEVKKEQKDKVLPTEVESASFEKKEILKTLFPALDDYELELKSLRYQQDPQTHEIIIEVINSETGEVLRTVPEQGFLKLSDKIKAQSGAFLNIHG